VAQRRLAQWWLAQRRLAELLAQLVAPKAVGWMSLSTTADATVPVITTVVVQPTPFCNIDCTYCYLPRRDVKTVMQQDTIAALFDKVFVSGWAAPQLTVIWHAGEPLVLPVAFYQAAFEAIEALRPPEVAVRHCFQTNGMLLTPAWCDFLKQHDVGIGVSIDGPRHLHDAHRMTRSGRGTFDRTAAGI